MKKFISMILCLAGVACTLISCSGKSESAVGFDTSKTVTVISREEGSGTRDAFVELTGVLVKDSAGNKTDNTTLDAQIIDATQTVISTVVGNPYSIGYISLGSLNNTVKAVKVDGVAPSSETVKDGSYKLSRPFNIATKADLSEVAQDFVSFILSTEGQKVVSDNGYVALDTTAPYAGSKPAGKIVIAGSSSVSPVMEKLKEAYLAVNTSAEIQIQTTDSSSGIKGAETGTCDIGMASRDLKESETANLTSTKIAMDGIAVIVNKQNTAENLTKDQIKSLFTGETEKWSGVTD